MKHCVSGMYLAFCFMGLFLGRLPDCEALPWHEWQIQAYIVQESRRAGYLVAGDMNAGKRNPGQAKATGILAGAPDLRYYLGGPRLIQIELKVEPKGRLSQDQKDLHASLAAMGFEVHTVFARTPLAGWDRVRGILPPLSQGF